MANACVSDEITQAIDDEVANFEEKNGRKLTKKELSEFKIKVTNQMLEAHHTIEVYKAKNGITEVVDTDELLAEINARTEAEKIAAMSEELSTGAVQEDIIDRLNKWGYHFNEDIVESIVDIDAKIEAEFKRIDADKTLNEEDIDLELIKNLIEKRQEASEKLYKYYPEALLAYLEGTRKQVPYSHINVDYRGKFLAGRYIGGLDAELRKAGLFKIAMDGKNDLDIATEFFRLKPDSKESASGNENAFRIAKIVDNYRKEIMARKNAAGAYVKELQGYINENPHDPYRMMSAGKDDWVEFMMKEKILDTQTSFGTMDELEIKKALEESFDKIASGDLMMIGTKRKSLAERISAHRELHFTNPKKWAKYNKKFGKQEGLMESIHHEFERAGKDIAAMELLGPNIENTKNTIMNHITELAKTNPELRKKWTGKMQNKILNQFDNIDGTSQKPIDGGLAMTGRWMRWLQNFKLGSMLLSQLSDIAFMSASLREFGDGFSGYLSGYGVGIKSLIDGLLINSGRSAREIADEFGVVIEGMISNAGERFTNLGNLPGWQARTQASFFKLAGANRWNNAMRTGASNFIAYKFGKLKNLEFEELPELLQKSLANHEIGKDRWSLIRKLGVKGEDGRVYITPTQMRNTKLVSDADIRKVLGKKLSDEQVESYRNVIEDNLRSYAYEVINDSVPTPGLRELRLTKGRAEYGTLAGELRSLFAQFKTFPMIAIRIGQKELGRGGAGVGGMLNLIIGTTVLGYCALTLKDLAKGRGPRNVSDNKMKILVSSMMQGGALGIYGDFLFGMQTRYGHGPLETMLGPSWSTAEDLTKLIFGGVSDVARGKFKPMKFGGKSLSIAQRNLPFVNLYFSKEIINTLIFASLQEEMNPGYKQRVERSMKKRFKNERLSFLQ